MCCVYMPSILVERPELLSPDFTPDELLFREKEVEELSFLFSHRLMRGVVPTHVLITGPSGSGKTATVKHVLSKFRTPGRSAYVIASGSGVKVAFRIASELGAPVPQRGISLEEAWERLCTAVGSDILVVVLDELDKMLVVEPDAPLLYFLTRRPKTWVIGISNNHGVLGMVKDERVLSSFNPWRIVFTPYSAQQVKEILASRVRSARAKVEEEALSLCSTLAVALTGGDMRYALTLLSSALQLAEKAGAPAVEVKHVEAAKDEVEKEFVLKSLASMQPVHKLLLLKGVYERGISSPSSLFEYANAEARRLGLNEYTFRRLSEFLNSLHVEGWVKILRKGARGRRGVLWEVAPANEDVGLVVQVVDSLLSQFLL